MEKIKILHLTDFHFSGNEKTINNEQRLISSLTKTLRRYRGNLDFLFFTGDLVWEGDDIEDFHSASKLLLENLIKGLDIEKTQVFICPGNHDVFRGQELEDITSSIMNLSNNEDLDKYVLKNNKRSLKASLENLANYFLFQNSFYTGHFKLGDELTDKMYGTHKRRLKGGKTVGITTLNSAWRANDSDSDTGNLLFPITFLKDASKKIHDCDIKILLLHHPLSDFKWWNKTILEDVIYKDYHLFFSGHVHENRDTLHITTDTGIYHSTSSATLSHAKDNIGFTILEVDVNSFELEILSAVFNSKEEEFFFGEAKPAQIPISKEKQEQNKFRITIRKRFQEILDESNQLFLSYKEMNNDSSFLQLFTPPIIREKSQSNPKSKESKKISFKEIQSEKDVNQILFGKDKSGKSAILYKSTLDYLMTYNELKILPLFIDCNHVLKKETKLDIITELATFYEVNKRKAAELSKEYHIKILIDNFKDNESLVLHPLSSYILQHNNSSIIATANETLFSSFSEGLIGEIDFKSLYIHDITRSEIRLLTDKWPNIPTTKREIILEKINKVFSQLNIPSNYWTVSLFIWIFEKNIDVNFGNNFQLINLYVDHLLDKDRFILSKKYKIDFTDLKDYLASLAYFLVKNYINNNYRITYSELIQFTENYKSSNKKFVIETEEIVNLILDKGIVKKGSDNLFTFRLNGVFEYFLGHYMAFDAKFRNEIIDDGHFYLSFQNEFEICSGIIPFDKDYLQKIFLKTKDIFEEPNAKVNFEKIDELLLSRVNSAFNLSTGITSILRETLGKPLESETQDSILETLSPSDQRISDVEAKKYYESITSDVDNLEKALYILGRVYRNSKLRNEEEFNNEVFDFILNSTCSLSLSLIDEITTLDNLDSKISEEQLIRLLTQFLPVVAQTFFFDMAIQVNFENILKEKIEEIKKKKKGNELKLLILYFSLIDLDLKNNKEYIDEAIEELDIPILKHTVLIKLYLYLSFKANGNKSLQRIIEKAIKKQEININSKKDIGQVEQQISQVKRDSLGKKN